MGNSFALLLIASVVLTICGYVFNEPILYVFGASDESYLYAKEYLNIYLAGTVFSMITTGMNGYINAQFLGPFQREGGKILQNGD